MDFIITWQFFISIGLILLIIEAFDGTFNLFLPLSIGSFGVGLILIFIPDINWKIVLSIFALISTLGFILIRNYVHKKPKDDINDY